MKNDPPWRAMQRRLPSNRLARLQAVVTDLFAEHSTCRLYRRVDMPDCPIA